MRYLVYAAILLNLTGCAVLTGDINYREPNSDVKYVNYIEIDKSKENVWKAMIPEIGKNFFVINNLDKASGLINISYSGDPEKYVDCGLLTSYVKNLKGERTYEFAGSKAFQQYENVYNNQLFYLTRKMTLEGRMNLVFEEVENNKTRITANTKYILTRSVSGTDVLGHILPPLTETISFNSGDVGRFTSGKHSLMCRPNGRFETDVLSLGKK